jgi:Homeodomain-like domain
LTIKDEIEHKGNGRPTAYDPKYVEMAAAMCRLGATDAELAREFGVSIPTVWHWRARYEDFANAVRVGKEFSNARVERSLFQKAVGYTYDSVKVFSYEGETFEHEIKEHVPPDTAACIYWLSNRDHKNWRNRHEVTGPEGGPIALRVIGSGMSVQDAASAYADTLKTIDGDFSVIGQQQQIVDQSGPPQLTPAQLRSKAALKKPVVSPKKSGSKKD